MSKILVFENTGQCTGRTSQNISGERQHIGGASHNIAVEASQNISGESQNMAQHVPPIFEIGGAIPYRPA